MHLASFCEITNYGVINQAFFEKVYITHATHIVIFNHINTGLLKLNFDTSNLFTELGYILMPGLPYITTHIYKCNIYRCE